MRRRTKLKSELLGLREDTYLWKNTSSVSSRLVTELLAVIVTQKSVNYKSKLYAFIL